MEFAVNASPASRDLHRRGLIQPDRFKCPAWPDLVAETRAEHPVYVHFPIQIGSGSGPVDAETGRPPDWDRIRQMMAQTATPCLNIHLVGRVADHPDLPPDSTDPAVVDALLEVWQRDLQPILDRFGADMIVGENNDDGRGRFLAASLHPESIRRFIEETGIGLLLDVGHAARVAHALNRDPHDYLTALPLSRLGEVHISGVQVFTAAWDAHYKSYGYDLSAYNLYEGGWQDHLPLTETDFDHLAWLLAEIEAGRARQPWVVSLEYGGYGHLWDAASDPAVIAEQVPRLTEMVRAANGRAVP